MHPRITRSTTLLIGLSLLIGCDSSPQTQQPAQPPAASRPATGTKYDYMVSEGGPHLLLPDSLGSFWHGVPASVIITGKVLDPRTEYGRACAAAPIPGALGHVTVDDGSALVFGDPVMSAWAPVPDEEGVDIFVLLDFVTLNTDALIDKARANTPDDAFVEMGIDWTLETDGATLLFAGDAIGHTAFGEVKIPIAAGKYRVLKGTYRFNRDHVLIYRIIPETID